MEADVDLIADNGLTCGYGGTTRAFCMAANAQTTGCKVSHSLGSKALFFYISSTETSEIHIHTGTVCS